MFHKESYMVFDTVFYHEPQKEPDIYDPVISPIHMPPKCIWKEHQVKRKNIFPSAAVTVSHLTWLFETEANKLPQIWQNNNIEEKLKKRERKYLYKQQHKSLGMIKK